MRARRRVSAFADCVRPALEGPVPCTQRARHVIQVTGFWRHTDGVDGTSMGDPHRCGAQHTRRSPVSLTGNSPDPCGQPESPDTDEKGRVEVKVGQVVRGDGDCRSELLTASRGAVLRCGVGAREAGRKKVFSVVLPPGGLHGCGGATPFSMVPVCVAEERERASPGPADGVFCKAARNSDTARAGTK